MDTVIPDEVIVEGLAEALNIGEETARAALLLDAVAPDWEANVNLDTLDMFSVTDCILGRQLGKHPYFDDCNGWVAALEKLGEAIGDSAEIDNANLYNFSHSTSDWYALIKARRALLGVSA